MAVLNLLTVHPVKYIFYIVSSAIKEVARDDEAALAMAAWAAADYGWTVEEIASVMKVESNLNVIADLVGQGSRLLADAGPGREWLRGVARRAIVYDRMTVVLIQEARGELPPLGSDGGSSAPPA